MAVVACGASFASTSAAEPVTGERARLSGLLRSGTEAAKGRDWKGCVDALWDALALEDAAKTAGDLALCEEQAGRFGDAMNHARRALAEATPDMMKKEPWKSYQAAVQRLSSQVGLVMITADPPHARVIIDGRPFGKADGQLIAVSYGKHTVAARLEGYEDASETRVVAPGSIPHVRFELKAKEKPASSSPVTAPAAATGATAVVARGSVSALAGPAPAAAGAAPSPSAGDAGSWIPEPCLPSRSVRGVLMPVACAGAAVFAVSAGAFRKSLFAPFRNSSRVTFWPLSVYVERVIQESRGSLEVRPSALLIRVGSHRRTRFFRP